MRHLLLVPAVLLDVLIAVIVAVIGWIITTGGGVAVIAGQRISVAGVDNPLIGLTLLGAIRYALLHRVPLFGRPSSSLTDVEAGTAARVTRLRESLDTLTVASAIRPVLMAVAAATLIKALLAWANPGFFSGDDVEIHEMSLRMLWKTDWSIWDLRNPFFPIGVIFPFQKLFAAAGAGSAATLIFAGRLPVVLLSSITVWLLWCAGRRIWPQALGWAAVAALMFAVARLHIAFGSSELPRPVATALVVGAFVLLQDPRLVRVLLAGVLLGTAASFRFSEAVFIAPVVLTLVLGRRWIAAVAVVVVTALTGLAIVGLTDAWYWGDAFHSLKAAFDYTIVQKLSSRGYQGPLWYALHAFDWVSPALLVLALLAAIKAPRRDDVWVWIPLVVFSCLPHKEARYVIPVIPFVCLMAARGLQLAARDWRPILVAALLTIGGLHDAGHWRLPRSNGDTRFARVASGVLPPESVVAAEQAWRLGGRIYLHPRRVLDLDPDRVADPAYLWRETPASAALILDRRNSSRPGVRAQLDARGYRVAPVAVPDSRYELWLPHTR